MRPCPLKLVHVITALSGGGAETMLFRLLSRIDREQFDCEVISMLEVGPVGKKIRDLGVPVGTLGMTQGVPNPMHLFRLAGRLRAARPDVIQTWMYHANLMGGIAAKLSRTGPVVWSIHHSNLQAGLNRRTTLWTVSACAPLSRWLPAKIVCCSEESRVVHIRAGYAPGKMCVIHNGFDVSEFDADESARADVRKELGIPADAILAGLVAWFDPQKDHRNFIQAAALVSARFPDVHFLMCGYGVCRENREIDSWVKQTGRPGNFHLLGHREDMPRLLASLDILASSSRGEAFSCVIGEALSCGVPCAVTDVGDSAAIVLDTGRVVPPGNPAALAGAIVELIDMGSEGRRNLGRLARRRVQQHFNLPSIVLRYQELYQEVVVRAGRQLLSCSRSV